jgi:hypothetical protein
MFVEWPFAHLKESGMSAQPINKLWITVLITLVAISCTAKNSSNSVGSSTLPAAYSVSGSLNISETAASEVPAYLANQKVTLQSMDGEQVAEGLTSPAGTFVINVGDAAKLRLAATKGVVNSTQIFKLAGIVKEDDAGKVRGMRKTIVINSSVLSSGKVPTFDSGLNLVDRVGAIRGRISLEGGAAPVGIDVFIPGSSYTAKTDDEGYFVLAFLAPGKYQVRADADGYGSFVVDEVVVKKDDTTVLDPLTLKIAAGPQIFSFSQNDGLSYTKTPSLALSLSSKGAIKYKVSEWSDYRNAVYQTINLYQDPFVFNYVITSSDGDKVLYIKVADKDGLEVESSLQTRLDTRNPYAPQFTVKADGALRSGYTKNTAVTIMPMNCDDVSKIFITEDAARRPEVSDFTTSCDAQSGSAYTLSSPEALKTLYLWVLDPVSQISSSPTTFTLAYDVTAPVLTGITDSGVFTRSVSIAPILSEKASLFYTIDGSTPTKDSTELVGTLVLIGNTTFKLVAIDYAGNSSEVVTRSYTIDSSAPFLGSVVIEGGAAITKKITAALTLSAVEADYMMFSENADFSGASWMPYATSGNYTFASSAGGSKKVYVKFKDGAGNELGKNGEIYDYILLDTAAPVAGGITLYAPESPSGSFDKLLLWENASSEADLSYEVEVASDASYATIVRSGTTPTTSWSVDPPFSSAGTYYWRVRAVDTAGNYSEWVTSGSDKRFTIRLFAQGYVATVSHRSGLDEEHYFGNKTMIYGESNDRIVVISNQKITTSGCTNCSAVHLYNMDTDTILHTFSEGGNESWKDGYGSSLGSCDLNNDGTDEIIVGAPYTSYLKNVASIDRTYTNAGKVFVYNGVGYAKMFEYTIEPQYATYDCNTYDGGGNCIVYGYQTWPWLDASWVPEAGRDRQYTGRSVSCLRNAAGADHLVISSPGYVNASAELTGRVDVVDYSSGAAPYYTIATSVYGAPYTEQWGSNGFGNDLVYLSKMKFTGHDGELLAISAPKKNVASFTGAGQVYLYRPSDMSLLATLSGTASSQEFGKSLFNLGNLNAATDGLGYQELAVRGNGIVRIYDGNTASTAPALFLAIKKSSGDTYSFGRSVRAIGDLTGDGRSEVAVSSPGLQIGGVWGSGAIHIYNYGDISASESSDTPILHNLAGKSSPQRFLGLDILASRDVNSDGVQDFIVATAPGLSAEKGAINEFSLDSMAPVQPSALTGSVTEEYMGYRVIRAGDFDADGTDDFVVSSPGANYLYTGVGKLQLISGADFSVLKTIYGTGQNQRLGTDITYFDQRLFVSSMDGNVWSIPRTDAMTMMALNETDHQGYPRFKNKTSLGWNSRIRVSGPGRPGEPYSPSDSWGYLLINSTGSFHDSVDTRYGFAAVYDSYFSGSYGYSPSNCLATASPVDSGCRCIIKGAATTNDNSDFGYAAAFVPDMTGDNLTDIAVSAPAASAGGSNTGKVYIFDGKLCKDQANLLVTDAKFTYTVAVDGSDGIGINFGRTLTAVPSVEAGYNSVLIVTNNDPANTSSTALGELFAITNTYRSARLVNGGTTIIAKNEGVVGNGITVTFVTNGVNNTSTTCTTVGSDITITLGRSSDGQPQGYYWDIEQAVQNDAGCDALVAAVNTPNDWSKSTDAPQANLTGGQNGSTHLYTHFKKPAGSLFGANVQPMDDVNGDGYPEFAISMAKAPGMIADDSGQVIVYSGKKMLQQGLTAEEVTTYPVSAELIKFYSPTPLFANFGASMFHADITGNGLSDFVIAAPLYSSSLKSSAGRVFIYPVEGLGASSD